MIEDGGKEPRRCRRRPFAERGKKAKKKKTVLFFNQKQNRPRTELTLNQRFPPTTQAANVFPSAEDATEKLELV